MALKLKITKTMTLPDRLQLTRLARAPELGPKILFFSGGSALNPISRFLTDYTHNTIHLITPFDSGGSSAKLRQAFHMPAVGDLRNRLMALADKSMTGNPDIIRLFSYRLPTDQEGPGLVASLRRMIEGEDEMVAAIPDPLRKIVRTHLGFFCDQMPPTFDLRGASIGNLVLAGGYLNNGRHLDPVVYIFSKLAEVRGTVKTIINSDLQLATELEDGQLLVGQHLITGREAPPLVSPIKKVFLTDHGSCPTPVRPVIRQKTVDLITSADLICYSIGSFYSSLIANLLPDGVSKAVTASDCPKIFIPNTTRDAELVNRGLLFQVRELLSYLQPNGQAEIPGHAWLNFVLLDSKHGDYTSLDNVQEIEDMGVKIIDLDLITEASRPYLDPGKVSEVLLSLV